MSSLFLILILDIDHLFNFHIYILENNDNFQSGSILSIQKVRSSEECCATAERNVGLAGQR